MMRSSCLVAVLVIAVVAAGACGSGARRGPQAGGEWAAGLEGESEIDGDLDKAAERWRREISEQAWQDDARVLALAADPSAADSSEQSERASEVERDPPAPATFWGRFKARADTVGKASFAALTVAAALAAMVAPYLLL